MKPILSAFTKPADARPPVQYTARQGSLYQSGFGGASLTLMSAMGSNGTLFATVNRTSNATSQVEWKLWRKARSGKEEDRVEVTSHLALDVWNRPNPFMPRQLYVETFQQHVDLVGEGWWVVAHNAFGWPESMWVVRPDRIAPVASPDLGVSGYVYTNPTGERVPLELNEVIRLRMPNPADPGPAGRGMGAVQSILAQVEAVAFGAQWNRNFFANSAVPGGVITVPESLNDSDFRRLRDQWSENHGGVQNAHRVAILENGIGWEPGAVQKDMQFVELLNSSRDIIREAFGMPKFMLGEVDDVNRATAEAADAMFGTWLQTPRLERIKSALNTQFLPQFLPPGVDDVEFDYETPVPPDQESENATLTARVNAYSVLVAAGVEPSDAASVCDLPDMAVTKPEPQPVVVPAPDGVPADA